MRLPTDAIKELLRSANKNTSYIKEKIETDLIKTSPVDTGLFKRQWETLDISKLSFKIYNKTPYGSILAGGRRMGSHGRMIGSLQWRLGIAPMVSEWELDIKKRFNNVL